MISVIRVKHNARPIRGLRGERGQELIEYALILPLLLLLLFGIIDFGIVIFSFDAIANAAREGARAGIIPATTDSEVIDATRRLTIGLDQDPARLQINLLERCENGIVRMEVTYEAPLIVGYFVPSSGDLTIPLRSVATMNCE